MKQIEFIKQTNSTNALLWSMIREKNLPEGFVLQTDFQTAGKGQASNSWESAEGKNLLFSMVLYPRHIRPDEQFIVSQLVSIALKRALDEITDGVTVKWPNDIYWNNKKLAGILIESSLQGMQIKSLVIGVGLNVNQTSFESNAPNPISLKQITKKQCARKKLLKSICEHILCLYQELNYNEIRAEYAQILYRKDGYHRFSANGKEFHARIHTVHPDGQLELETESGERKTFYFKEVSFLI